MRATAGWQKELWPEIAMSGGGYSHLVETSLTVFFEATWFNSTYVADSVTLSDSDFRAVMGEVGMVYTF